MFPSDEIIIEKKKEIEDISINYDYQKEREE